MMEGFLEFISTILEVKSNEISLETKKDDCEKWDSLMHLRIVMEIEQKYGVEIPFENISKITAIKDFYEYVK